MGTFESPDLVRPLAGRHVDVTITCWGGPLFLVTGFFRRVRSYILIATQPLEGENADRHYVIPSDEEFFKALHWLREQLMATEASQRLPA